MESVKSWRDDKADHRDGMSEREEDTGEEQMTRAEVQRLVPEAVTEALAAALKPAGETQEDAGGPGPSEKAARTSRDKDDSGE